MFRLTYTTPTEWVRAVEAAPLALLADHAHCEWKAAASAQALVGKYANRRGLATKLCAVAAEELEHFARVVELLHARGGELGPFVHSPYAQALVQRSNSEAARGTIEKDDVLLERLLLSAVIEARSLERFQLLATHARDTGLAAFYATLSSSEARHRALFLELARESFAAAKVAARWSVLARLEGEILGELALEPRIHSGMARMAGMAGMRTDQRVSVAASAASASRAADRTDGS